MEAIYTAVATSSGDGRNGHVQSEDGLIDTDVRIPTEMGGPGGAPNPELLFAAGYAACFHSALRAVGGRQKQDVDGTQVSASVSIGTVEGGFGLAVVLDVDVPALEHDEAVKLVDAAHQMCPYSNATRGNIEVTLNVL